MALRTVRLLDPANGLVAVVTVDEEADHFGGTIDLSTTPPAVRAVFDEFEEVVNGQMFSFLDEVEAKVAALRITAEFPDGTSAPVENLQVYPSTGQVSFTSASTAVGRLPDRPPVADTSGGQQWAT